MKNKIVVVALVMVFGSAVAQNQPAPTKPHSPTEKTQNVQSKIDLNQADVKQLTHIFTGIGPKRAEAIVNYRQTHGPFKSIQDLAMVKGVGKAFVTHHLNELEDKLVVK